MIQAWFVSDIHITDMSDEKAKIFLAFLRSLKSERLCTHLFLVGDIFDLWIGNHKFFQKKFAPIIEQIQFLVNQGVEVHYFEGNHDLYLKGFWENRLGVHVHSGPEYFELGAKMFRVEHGDQTDPEDRGYLFLRWFLRTPLMRLVAFLLPGVFVQAIGDWMSQTSRQYTSSLKVIKDEVARRKLQVHSHRAYQEHEYDVLVYGHVHIQDDYRGKEGVKSFRALNLGTWLVSPEVLHYADQNLTFVRLS
jgi:UDP-2,3-diacylglucosamine hydrolase